MSIGEKSFIPFQEIKDRKVIVVDGLHPRAFTLSHWKGANIHPNYAADTSGEIVLKAIEQHAEELNVPYVSATHFDIDGFVGVFALFYPELAMRNKEVLTQMAIIGDFREYEPSKVGSEEALKLCCWMNKMERDLFYRPFEEKDELEECVPKFEYFLKEFPTVLNNINQYEDIWKDEYEQVTLGLEKIEKREIMKDLDFMMVKAKEPVHYYSLFSKSEGSDIILSIYPDQRYELEYKYTTWIDLATRRNLPRIDLRPLANNLNQMETSEFHWDVDRITDTGPILRLEKDKLSEAERYAHPFERKIYSSSIPESEFINLVLAYYNKGLKGIKAKKSWTWEEMKSIRLLVN